MSDIQKFSLLAIKCAQCGDPILRATKAETYDRVYCANCGASGDYKEVIERGAGLVGGLLTPEEADYLREQFRLTRKSLK